jgi:chromosome segregation ATPase
MHMPQISKIRIVNFQYNDGKRLIADELFDFARGDKGPSDVLINLANGGGKSVLVQLIMQPIIPRAKVAGRRIESFFTKSTDHCFVVLEWSLDNSKTKLMTGIAMAASDAAGDPDAERGFRIKYYTFLSRYSDYRGSCNIISLPFSMKENGRFVPAGFDDIRNLSRRAGSELIRFSSDDSVKWREQLEEYGIFQDEWKVIEELNSNEDGLSKYFSMKKTSDAVIDQLILPRIEEKQHRSASSDDSSLETMLISYAEQFSRQKDTVREREILAGFSESLKTAKEQTERLWSDKDALDQSIGALFSFHDALKSEIDSKKADVAALQSEQTRLRAGITKIQWEKASAEYYSAEKAFHLEIERYQKAEAERTAAEDRRSTAQKKLKLLECARYLQELRSIEDRIAVIEAEIISRETRSESAQQLAALKYSAHAAIESSLRQITPEINGLMEEKASGESALQTLEAELGALLAEVEAAVSEVGKAEGIWNKQCEDNDALVETLRISTLRMFNGEYPDEDLQNWKIDLDTQKLAAEKAIASSRTEIAQLEARKEAIPQELADVNRQAEDFRSALQALDDRIAEFKEHEARVRTVCNNYGLDFSLRFADKHRKYLSEQIESVAAVIGAEQQKLTSVEEAVAAAKRGTLHIPRALLDFLDSTGLDYISLEKYLLTQINNGLLGKEQVKELLEQYPHAAYGIIIDDSVLPTILKEAEGQWLPALLPVLTKNDVEQMMRGEADAPLAIAAFSRDYFADADTYVRRLETDRSAIAERIDRLTERQKAYQDAADILESFSAYEESWLEKAEKERADTESAVIAKNDTAAALKAELARLKGAVEEAKAQTDALHEQIVMIHEKHSSYAKLLDGLKEEERLNEVLSDRRRICDSAKKRRSGCEAAIVQKEEELSRISEHLKELTEIRVELQKGLEEVSGAPEAELIQDDWASLLNRYRELLMRQSEDLQRLTTDRDLLYNEKTKTQKELERRACQLEDYAQLF